MLLLFMFREVLIMSKTQLEKKYSLAAKQWVAGAALAA